MVMSTNEAKISAKLVQASISVKHKVGFFLDPNKSKPDISALVTEVPSTVTFQLPDNHWISMNSSID